MDRVLALALAVAVVGCSGPAPQRLVGGDAVLAGVSVAQKWVAVLTGATRLATGAHVGALRLVPTGGGAAVTLDGRSSGGVFNRGTTLWYLGGVTVVSEGTPATDHVYGALYVWTPSLAAPIKLADNVREYSVSQDGSTCVFIDWAQQTIDPANTGALAAAYAPSCSDGGCAPIAIASGVTAAASAWRLSLDGRRVLVTLRGAAATDPGQVLLIAADAGSTQRLSTGADARSAMMTPAGDTVAWVEGATEIHVMPVGGAATVLVPSSPLLDSASMIDASSFIAKTRELATGPAALAKVTAAGTTPLAVQRPQQYFVSQAVAGKTDRYVFFQLATIAANGEPDLWLLDHTNPGAQPVQLGGGVDSPIAGAVGFSDDGSMIEYLDNFDPVTRRGDEYVAPLAMPTRSLVATGVHNAAFIPGSTRLMYIAAADAVTGAGVLSTLSSPTGLADIQSVGIVNFADPRDPPARTWFTQTTGAPDDGVWSMPQP
jgi:hypothetical protein